MGLTEFEEALMEFSWDSASSTIRDVSADAEPLGLRFVQIPANMDTVEQ
jgi:hypothetical protein